MPTDIPTPAPAEFAGHTPQWWCPTCVEWIDGQHVTNEETHDPRSDRGCGGAVFADDGSATLHGTKPAPALLARALKAERTGEGTAGVHRRTCA